MTRLAQRGASWGAAAVAVALTVGGAVEVLAGDPLTGTLRLTAGALLIITCHNTSARR